MGICEVESDAELVALASCGDARAFEVLTGRYRGVMYSVCRRITCDDQDAIDALQDALLAAWLRMGSFEGRSTVRTWLFRIAVNAAIDQVRRRPHQDFRSDALVEECSSATNVESVVVARATVDWALGRLPPQFRAPTVLREYYGFSYLEIADVLNIPIDTVKSRISRGRQALAELIMPGYRTRALP